LFVLFAFAIEIILIVKEGFTDHKQDFNNLEVGALITLFLGNAYSVWTVLFTMGRVPFVSREEFAFSVYKWAIFHEPAAAQLATAMTQFPITFHVGPFEWSSEVSKGYTIFLLGLLGVFVGVQIPEFE
jgi:hypothetical protein